MSSTISLMGVPKGDPILKEGIAEFIEGVSVKYNNRFVCVFPDSQCTIKIKAYIAGRGSLTKENVHTMKGEQPSLGEPGLRTGFSQSILKLWGKKERVVLTWEIRLPESLAYMSDDFFEGKQASFIINKMKEQLKEEQEKMIKVSLGVVVAAVVVLAVQYFKRV